MNLRINISAFDIGRNLYIFYDKKFWMVFKGKIAIRWHTEVPNWWRRINRAANKC